MNSKTLEAAVFRTRTEGLLDWFWPTTALGFVALLRAVLHWSKVV